MSQPHEPPAMASPQASPARLLAPPANWSHVRSRSAVTGKRSRSNSSSSSGSALSACTSSQLSSASSSASSGGYFRLRDGVSASPSDASSPASSVASGSLSPSQAPRKVARCDRSEDLGIASGAPLDNASRKLESASLSVCSQALTSDSESEGAELGHLRGHVQSFGLRDPKATSPSPSSAPVGKGFVDGLVDAAVATLESIWYAPLDAAGNDVPQQASQACAVSPGLPLQLFIRETLRRSRTSCSTLQAALLYCSRVAPIVLRKRREYEQGATAEEPFKPAFPSLPPPDALTARSMNAALPPAPLVLCARRMFLAATMAASKFLQDRNYSNRAWSRISGLPTRELADVERVFMSAIGYDLVVRTEEWQQWTAKMRNRVDEVKAAAAVRAAVAQAAQLVADAAGASDALEAVATAVVDAPVKDASSGTDSVQLSVPGSEGRRASFARTISDNVSGAALAFDSAVSVPVIPHVQVDRSQPIFEAPSQDVSTDKLTVGEELGGKCAEAKPALISSMPLPYPMVSSRVSQAGSFNANRRHGLGSRSHSHPHRPDGVSVGRERNLLHMHALVRAAAMSSEAAMV